MAKNIFTATDPAGFTHQRQSARTYLFTVVAPYTAEHRAYWQGVLEHGMTNAKHTLAKIDAGHYQNLGWCSRRDLAEQLARSHPGSTILDAVKKGSP